MRTHIKFNVTNQSDHPLAFFCFQQPAKYTGNSTVYSNSIRNAILAPYSSSASTYTFLLNMQFFAGVQQRYTPPEVGQQSGYLSAIRPIDLTPAADSTTPAANNATTLSLSPFGLSAPYADTDVQPGAFRFVSPVFDPTKNSLVYAGSAVQLDDGSVVLSSFTNLYANQNLDCQPIFQFYLQTGSYEAGTVMNFTSLSVAAAMCDATEGDNTFDVAYTADGTWTVTPSYTSYY